MAMNPLVGVPETRSANADSAPARASEAHIQRVATEGVAAHPHQNSLATIGETGEARDLVDAVHLLCQLYGRYPGLLDLAVANCSDPKIRPWLAAAAEAFEAERHFLLRLTACVGPLPSTPGAANTEAAMVGQRKALETLAASERRGCALGAATALVSEWMVIRPLLNRAASRMNEEAPACTLPSLQSIAEIVDEASESMAAERALGFGAMQLLLQHRGLFDILEARKEARDRF